MQGFVTYRLNERNGRWVPVYAGHRRDDAEALRDETDAAGRAAPAFIHQCSYEEAHARYSAGAISDAAATLLSQGIAA